MYPFGKKSIEAITERDIIDLQEPEGPSLDYKIDVSGAADWKREFRKDVTSFANSAGGVLVLGVAESNKKPTSHRPGVNFFKGKKSEKFEQELYNALFSCVTPPLPNVKVKAIPIPSSPDALHYCVVAIEGRSWRGPHCFKGQPSENAVSFYSRRDADNHPMEYPELAESFREQASLLGQVHGFRNTRLEIIDRGWSPLGGYLSKALILHVIPHRLVVVDHPSIDLKPLKKDAHALRASGWSGWDPVEPSCSSRFEFEGLVTTFRSEETTQDLGYLQLHRGGAVELVDQFLLRDQPLTPDQFCHELLAATHRCWDLLDGLGVRAPHEVCFTIWDHSGRQNKGTTLINGNVFVYPTSRIEQREDITPDLTSLCEHVAQTFRLASPSQHVLKTNFPKTSFPWHSQSR